LRGLLPAEIRKVSELFTIPEIAAAADVPVELVLELADSDHLLIVDGLMREADAVALVRSLHATPGARPPLSPIVPTRRRSGLPLAASGTLHAVGLAAFLIASSLGLLKANETDATLPDKTTVRMVFMMTPGPGGGGGGGGLQIPRPPPRAERQAPTVKKTSSPVPPPRPYRPPPRPVTREVVTPPPPRPTPLPVQAPVVPDPGDAQDGIGEGDGSGIGAGSGGGTGGGPFRPGSGIEPPQLLREVRPVYTDEARRRAIEGDVVMEIVVRRDGTVGDVRVLRTLGSGLEQRAITAVRQWTFAPARRLGSAVDVVVEVAVGFTLR